MSMISKKLTLMVNRGFLSHYPLIYITGSEEDRIQATLTSMAQIKYGDKQKLVSWSAWQGFSDTHDAKQPLEAIKRISSTEEPTLFLLKDLPDFFDDKVVIRALRDLYYQLKYKDIYICITYPSIILPETLKKEVYLLEMPLPSAEDVFSYLNNFIESRSLQNKLPESTLQQLTIAMMGLTLSEIEHLLIRLFSQKHIEFSQLISEAHTEKSQIVIKESCLDFVSTINSLDQIGGLDNLKNWVLQRKSLFTEKAFNSGLPLPKGVLFMGVSGCGKSLAAKTIATAWNVPLVRLDMSLVLSGAYGPPEVAFANATHIAEQISPIVLWIDELENSFGYDGNNAQQSSNTISSSFLTWMQDKSPKVFLAATANRIQQIPAELMRKGRFDQLFFLDLPNQEERKQILKIHIVLQGGNPDEFDLGYISAATKEWSGAEIEEAIKSARINAYQQDRSFTDDDINQTLKDMVPLSHTMKEQITAIKDWSFQRAVPASTVDKENP